MTKKKTRSDPLLTRLEKEVTDTLDKKELTDSDRLKAIEAGIKLLSIRHKIDAGGDSDGSFFAGK